MEVVKIAFLKLASNKCPYIDWESKLDPKIRAIIRIRINRLRLANFGDCKKIKGIANLYELRIHVGPRFRVYFGKVNEQLVILLCAGSKRTQIRDIEKAKEYWKTYRL